jgi:hypothetical protein
VRSSIPVLLLLAALGPLAPAQEDPVVVQLPRETTLGELRKWPGEWLGREVRFVVQFKAVAEDVPRYVTRFGSHEWLALEVWPDERFTWNVDVWDDPARTLFVARGTALENVVHAARPHARYEVTGHVRETLLGEPWIAVERLERLDGEVGEGTILCVGRARELVGEGRFELAVEQYERAKAAPLPPHARAAIEEEVQAARDLQERLRPDRASRLR